MYATALISPSIMSLNCFQSSDILFLYLILHVTGMKSGSKKEVGATSYSSSWHTQNHNPTYIWY